MTRVVVRLPRRSGTGPRAAVAGAGRLPVRDGRGAAARRPAATAAHPPAGPDRLRQDDRGRRAGHAVHRLRARHRAAAHRAAGRRLRGGGGGRRGAAAAPHVPAHVRAAHVPGPRGQRAGRGLAARARRPVPRPRRRLHRAPTVHQDRGDRRLIRRPATATATAVHAAR